MSTLTLAEVPRLAQVDRRTFRADYLSPRRPVVLERLAADWPAVHRWTPEYLAARFGERPVRVYDASFAAPGRFYMSSLRSLPFARFLSGILTERRDLRMFLHNIAREMPELVEDIRFPDLADGFSQRFVFTFFGCQGSVTPIHYDIDMGHVFHTALFGRRRVILFPQAESARLYRHPFTVRSYIDAARPDFERFPHLRGARGWSVTLSPGETLFIPSGFWHQVIYEEAGYAISLRCPSERLLPRLQGMLNLLLISPLDRALNLLLDKRWYAWKERAAWRRAEQT
ncbi:MAG: cupin-like domain-containing protein [Gammaproteobacteria bacterium]